MCIYFESVLSNYHAISFAFFFFLCVVKILHACLAETSKKGSEIHRRRITGCVQAFILCLYTHKGYYMSLKDIFLGIWDRERSCRNMEHFM